MIAFEVPFSVGLGLMTPQSLLPNPVLVPALAVGAVVGRRLTPQLAGLVRADRARAHARVGQAPSGRLTHPAVNPATSASMRFARVSGRAADSTG